MPGRGRRQPAADSRRRRCRALPADCAGRQGQLRALSGLCSRSRAATTSTRSWRGPTSSLSTRRRSSSWRATAPELQSEVVGVPFGDLGVSLGDFNGAPLGEVSAAQEIYINLRLLQHGEELGAGALDGETEVLIENGVATFSGVSARGRRGHGLPARVLDAGPRRGRHAAHGPRSRSTHKACTCRTWRTPPWRARSSPPSTPRSSTPTASRSSPSARLTGGRFHPPHSA